MFQKKLLDKNFRKLILFLENCCLSDLIKVLTLKSFDCYDSQFVSYWINKIFRFGKVWFCQHFKTIKLIINFFKNFALENLNHILKKKAEVELLDSKGSISSQWRHNLSTGDLNWNISSLIIGFCVLSFSSQNKGLIIPVRKMYWIFH